MNDYIVILEEGSGMDINTRVFRVAANDPHEAIKAVFKAVENDEPESIEEFSEEECLYLVDGDSWTARVLDLNVLPKIKCLKGHNED